MLGDYGGDDNAFSSLWEALPSVAVVGGQVSLLDPIVFRISISLSLLYEKLRVEKENWLI